MPKRKYKPGGCFGERVDRLIQATGWTDAEANLAFGFGIHTGGAKSPVERVRRGGHAAPLFVDKLNQLERRHAKDLKLLDVEGKEWAIRQLKQRAQAMRSHDFTALGPGSAVPAPDAASGDGKRLREVVLVSRSGRVVARKSIEEWVARHAPVPGGSHDHGPPAEGKI